MHVSCSISSMLMVLLINRILSFSKETSAFLIIWSPLGVLTWLLSLILTGTTFSPRHLKVKHLWFWKSTIFNWILSNQRKISLLSPLYSVLICKCRFLILFFHMFSYLFLINRTIFVRETSFQHRSLPAVEQPPPINNKVWCDWNTATQSKHHLLQHTTVRSRRKTSEECTEELPVPHKGHKQNTAEDKQSNQKTNKQ